MSRIVAIVGASADRAKFSNKSIRAHARQGWQVWPVNPKGGTIEGWPVFRSLADLPARPDRVSLYLPPDVGLLVLPAVAALRPTEFFVNPGAESDLLVSEARRMKLDPILACSIVDVGESPADFS